MPKRKGQDFSTPEENPRFHDTYQFLRRYRDATYSLKVVVHQMENQFKVQYGSSIDEFLDSIYAAGADLAGSDIAERAKSIERSNRMLKLLESSVDLLRNNHKYGEQYYWILLSLAAAAEEHGRNPGKAGAAHSQYLLPYLLPETPPGDRSSEQHPLGLYGKGNHRHPE